MRMAKWTGKFVAGEAGMKRLALSFAALLAALAVSASATVSASDAGSPPWVPSADESAFDGPGDAYSDALLDCYASPERGKSDPDAPHLGPPRITRSPIFGLILRADFAPQKWSDPGVHRMICWGDRAMAEMHLSVPPLYSGSAAEPDAATQAAIAGWKERRKARALARAAAPHPPPPDRETMRLLEGIWLIGEAPGTGKCISSTSLQTQIEFEFGKSGGRALIFEPPDLFTVVALGGVDKSDGVLTLLTAARGGGWTAFMRLKPVGAGRLDLLPRPEQPPDTKAQTAYACGEPDRSVNAGVDFSRLAALTPPINGGWAFPAVVDGVSDADVCAAKLPRPSLMMERKWIQFELLGPVHYWVLGFGLPHRLEYDYVRSVEARGADTLVLHMQTHQKGAGWDNRAAGGDKFDLTVIDRGSRIEIPELATSFVRCKPGQLGSAGLHG